MGIKIQLFPEKDFVEILNLESHMLCVYIYIYLFIYLFKRFKIQDFKIILLGILNLESHMCKKNGAQDSIFHHSRKACFEVLNLEFQIVKLNVSQQSWVQNSQL